MVDQSSVSADPTSSLIFPAVNQAAFDYLDAALERGERIHCAASVSVSSAAKGVPFHHLPQIYDGDFVEQLNALCTKFQIRNIICPVSTVHDFVGRLISQGRVQLKLIGRSPIQAQMEQHYRLMQKTRLLSPHMDLCADGAPALSELDLAAVLRYSSSIYGESNDEKLVAILGVLNSAPKGDLIEIGCLMGRSAFVLSYAAKHYKLGSLLTVDPWSLAECIQSDSPDNLRDVSQEWDFEVLREGFYINIAPSETSSHVHLRMPSGDAFPLYCNQPALPNRSGALVHFTKSISAIHIDGNHDYESVKLDCELWLTRVQAGTWLILDDYIWAHGDGPYRVGNALLENEWHRIRRSFVCGKALFVQFDS